MSVSENRGPCALLSAIPVTLMKALLRTGKLDTEEGSGDC